MLNDETNTRHPQCPEEICGRRQGRGACTLCESLKERDAFWRLVSGSWLVLPLRGVWRILTRAYHILTSWGCDAWKYLTSEKGYRIVVPALVTILGGYVGLYAIIEARHERQLNRALFAQNRFMTLAASGNPGGLNAALAEYETLKGMEVLDAPDFWRCWRWGNTRKENERVLRRWAQKFFNGCPQDWCGQGLDLAILGHGDLVGADLRNVNLQNANLHGANLSEANLRMANLRMAKLRGADLRMANLRMANLRGADLRWADITQPQLDTACVDETTRLPTTLSIGATSLSHREECAKLWK